MGWLMLAKLKGSIRRKASTCVASSGSTDHVQFAFKTFGQETSGTAGDVDIFANQIAVDPGHEVIGVEVDKHFNRLKAGIAALIGHQPTYPSKKGATGRVYGLVYSGLDTGFAISPVVFGAFMDHGWYGATLMGAAAVLLLSVVAALGVGARTQR